MCFHNKKKVRKIQDFSSDNYKTTGFKYIKIEVKKIYPWTILNKCRCGNKHPWMHGFAHPYIHAIVDEPVYRVVCHRCFRHTHKGTYKNIVKEWNEKN